MADLDPVARARAIAARLAATALPGDTLGKRKSRWEEDGVGGGPGPVPLGDRKRKKVFIPVDKYPDINFMGLLIGPRGSNQKRMEDESGAKILIRGKGSSKDPSGDPDDEDELHVLITADTDEAIAKAQSAVEDILFNPQQAMKLKQEQLRKVAELNGTLNENYDRGDGGGPTGHYGPPPGTGAGKDDNSFDMQVPRDLVGYIIGRGGETIRDLQLKSGAHIQIVREDESTMGSPHRIVNLSGTQEAVDLAQKLIQKLIDERASGGRGDFRERDDRDRLDRYGGVNPDGSDTLELLVPNDRVGLIIGRGGCTIKAIQQRTGTSITIPQTPDPNTPNMRLITIRGTMDSKEAAKQEITQMLSEDSGPRGGGGGGGHYGGGRNTTTIYMQVPNDRVGVVIGKRGETIRGIQDRHGVRIQVPQVPDAGSNPSVRTISIEGPPESLAGAKEEVDMVILQGAGTQGVGGYNQQSSYGGGGQYGSSSYGAAAGGYDQQYGQQQYGAYDAQAAQGYDAAYYQQYYQQGADATAAVAATGTEAAVTADPNAAAATADPNDPNAYWNGFYEYAAYYGIDAANNAWGVTGEAAVASAEAYQQYLQQAAATGTDASADATATSTSTEATEAPPQAEGPPGAS